MEEGAKRRLAGAAVIVALLVIFLPMLLEEDAQSPIPEPEPEMSTPPRPDFDVGYDTSEQPFEPQFPTYEESLPGSPQVPHELTPPALFDAPATAEPEIAPELELPSELEMPEDLATPGELETPSERAPEPAQTKDPTVAKKSPPPASKPPRAPEPAVARPPPARPAPPAKTSANLSSWVIQVASLRERERAYTLVQDLRAKGFPAYIEEAQVRQKLWHRVRVGPEIDRKQIDSMAASLKAKMGLDVQIQRYP